MSRFTPTAKSLTLQERIAELAAQESALKPKVAHHSDGRELIPSEVQAQTRRGNSALRQNRSQTSGYTVDDEGLTNAYAIKPAVYFASFPSPEQQRRYLIQGAMATLFIALTVVIAFVVS